MTDNRDPFDAWLGAEVEPLAPPAGAYQRIRRRARRRKARRVLASAAGLAAVVAVAVTAPGLVSGLHDRISGQASHTGVAAGKSAPGPASSGNAQDHGLVPAPKSSLSAAGSGAAVPRNFQPTSVTFIGPHIGAVIGQAGTPGHCATSYCTSLAGTSDYGASWYGVSAPVTGPPYGAAGVSQIRFLNTRDGWAFGPALWDTQDGGAHWGQESTAGLRVTDLETAGNRAFALLASCTGGGSNYAADCTSFSLYSSAAGAGQWTLVPGATASLQSGSTPGAASLVLTAGRGYLLAPSGQLLTGPLTGAAWTVATATVPCAPGPPGADGQPTAALLAADPAGLVLMCASPAPGADTQLKSIFQSADGGATWSAAGSGPATGLAASFAAQAGGLLLLATDAGIFRSGDSGGTWQLAQASPAGAAPGQAGFSYVGMTSATDGVALPADPALHELFTTSDGGQTWQQSAVSGP